MAAEVEIGNVQHFKAGLAQSDRIKWRELGDALFAHYFIGGWIFKTVAGWVVKHINFEAAQACFQLRRQIGMVIRQRLVHGHLVGVVFHVFGFALGRHIIEHFFHHGLQRFGHVSHDVFIDRLFVAVVRAEYLDLIDFQIIWRICKFLGGLNCRLFEFLGAIVKKARAGQQAKNEAGMLRFHVLMYISMVREKFQV